MSALKNLCWLFCCPPLPSRIAAKIAFIPPEPTYDFVDADAVDAADAAAPPSANVPKLETTPIDRSTSRKGKREYLSMVDDGVLRTDRVQVMRLRTRRRTVIAGMFYEHLGASLTILFSHGNAVDLGQMAPICIRLARDLRCNIMLYDYSGYGLSTGESTEENLYADIDAAWDYLVEERQIPPSHIVLYGQSIGTVPSVDLGARKNPLAVVLHSPLASGIRVFKKVPATCCCDPFPSVEKIHLIESQVLIIHGLADKMISADHGKMLHAKCTNPAIPLWVRNAGHNDIESFPEYMGRLRIFFDELYASLPSTCRPSIIHQSMQMLLMQPGQDAAQGSAAVPATAPSRSRIPSAVEQASVAPTSATTTTTTTTATPATTTSTSSTTTPASTAAGGVSDPIAAQGSVRRPLSYSNSYRRATVRKQGKQPLGAVFAAPDGAA
eukprot:Opistho-2@68033